MPAGAVCFKIDVYCVMVVNIDYFRVEFVFMLHSFLSFAYRSIYMRPALDSGGLSCVGMVVSCLGVALARFRLLCRGIRR